MLKKLENKIKNIDWEGVVAIGVLIAIALVVLAGRGGNEFYPGN